MNAAAPADRSPDDADLAALQALLDRLPQDFEPLDVVMIDGYLCGVLLQPKAVPESHWLPALIDLEGRAPPPDFDLPRLRSLVLRRHGELARAIERRSWFDPWIYELDEAASPSETVMPWVAGFATALDLFPQLMDRFGDHLLEPLAGIYRHLDPDELEDADALIELIDAIEPASTLAEAVEDLVQGVLLIADVSRPRAAVRGPSRQRAAPPTGRGPRRR
jgi:uncharacterized protein